MIFSSKLSVLKANLADYLVGMIELRLLLCVLLLLPLMAHAEQSSVNADDAFTVRLPVAQRSADVDPAKVLEGLKMVVARLRGGNEQAVRAMLVQPLDYLRDYRYEAAVDPSQGVALLVLSFEGDAITRQLQQEKEPVVQTQGVNLLHWWALESGTARQIVGKPKTVWSSAETTRFADVLVATAVTHNVPMQLPVMDPRDARLIQPRDVFGFLLEPIQRVSRRYPNDGLVIGSVKSSAGGQWQGHWMLVVGTGSFWFESTQPSLNKLLDQAMLKISEQLSTIPKTLTPNQQMQWLDVTVVDVGSYPAQQALETYLGSLFWIDAVQLKTIAPQQLIYRLRTKILASELPLRFSEDNRLRLPDMPLSAASEAISSQHNNLIYRWMD